MPCACDYYCSLDRQRNTLRAVLAINSVMFFVIGSSRAELRAAPAG